MSELDDSSSSDMESEEDDAVFYEGDHVLRPHRHRKRFSIIEISDRNTVRKIMSFETHCAVLPSSWEVEFNLSKGARFENFTMGITLRRIDSGQTPLDGYVLAYLSNFDDKICPIPYPVNGLVPCFARMDLDAQRDVTETFMVDYHFRCLFENGRDTFRHDMLLIKTQLLIVGCCSSSGQKQGNVPRVRNE